ncbi:unnamed protein product, partial [Staurois parvus]
MMREWMSCLVVSGVRNVRILAMLRRRSLHVAEAESACCGGGVCTSLLKIGLGAGRIGWSP